MAQNWIHLQLHIIVCTVKPKPGPPGGSCNNTKQDKNYPIVLLFVCIDSAWWVLTSVFIDLFMTTEIVHSGKNLFVLVTRLFAQTLHITPRFGICSRCIMYSSSHISHAQQTRSIESMLGQYWDDVVDGGPTLPQLWFNASCLLGGLSVIVSSAVQSQNTVSLYLYLALQRRSAIQPCGSMK